MKLMWNIVLVVLIAICVNCQQIKETQFRENPFFAEWQSYRPEYVQLNDQEAAWWYSLGEYQYGRGDQEYYRPVRPDPAYYEYPPYGGGSSGTGGRDCELIPGPMRIRREFRELTGLERTAYHNAVLALASFCPSGCASCPSSTCRSAYGIFLEMHQSTNSPGAHGGASFLPFHREYCWRFENALISQGGYPVEYALPYWDTILDHDMPEPKDSVMWSNTFMGPISGDIGAIPGSPFYGMTVPLASPDPCDPSVFRDALDGTAHYLWDETVIDTLMSKTCFAHLHQHNDWTCPWGSCNYEGIHGAPHEWVRGDMGNFCSPSDPLFWLHHANIDCQWEEFRKHSQATDVEREYPLSNNGGPQSDWNREMSPFVGLINAHGLSTHYTQYYYKCSERPSGKECTSDDQCKPSDVVNPALWCDTNVNQCRSKIKVGGNCLRNGANMPNNACWCESTARQPACRNGVCRCLWIFVAKDVAATKFRI